MTPVQRVIADLTYIADRYEDLAECRFRGSQRPWQQPVISAEAREANDELARQERHDRDVDFPDTAPGLRPSARIMPPGEHGAPLHVDVLDALIDLLATADDLAERVAQAAGVERLPTPSSAMADAGPYLRHTAAHLPDIGHELLGYVAREVDRLRTSMDRHLGELTTGQRLLAECPWCRGVTASHPGGGDFTLRVRQRPDGEVLIVCESGACDPPEADCGERHRGHPAWNLHNEGEWLADRIERHKETAA